MHRSKLVLSLGVAAVLVTSGPAAAKGASSFRVVTPDGDSFVVTGADARAWWEDLWTNPDPPPEPFRCCTSPAAAARYAGGVWAQWGKRAAEAPEPYVIQGGWTALFYPSHLDAPPYIVMPIAQSGGGRRWPGWRVATQRMEDIVLSGAAEADEAAPAGDTGRSEIPSGIWPAAAAVALAAAGAGIVRRRRRTRVA